MGRGRGGCGTAPPPGPLPSGCAVGERDRRGGRGRGSFDRLPPACPLCNPLRLGRRAGRMRGSVGGGDGCAPRYPLTLLLSPWRGRGGMGAAEAGGSVPSLFGGAQDERGEGPAGRRLDGRPFVSFVFTQDGRTGEAIRRASVRDPSTGPSAGLGRASGWTDHERITRRWRRPPRRRGRGRRSTARGATS